MMRVMHATLMIRPYSGILQQMRWENSAACSLRIPWTAKVFSPAWHDRRDPLFKTAASVCKERRAGIAIRTQEYLSFRSEYYGWLYKQVEHYDVLVLRYNPADVLQAKFIQRIKKPVHLVYHTKPIPEFLASKTPINVVKACFEWVHAKKSGQAAAGLVAVTNEILQHVLATGRIHGKLKWVYPNGISLTDGQPAASPKHKQNVPVLVFIASRFCGWHGLDMLLQSAIKSRSDFRLHVVGEAESLDINMAKSDTRISFHGHLDPESLKAILESADVGLSSFGLHRMGMSEACTLKTREYLGNGIPVYSGHRDVFPEHFPFYRTGEPAIASILNYARSMSGVERPSVRESAAPYIEKKCLLKQFYNFLEETTDGARGSK
jgi:hypothetical protein